MFEGTPDTHVIRSAKACMEETLRRLPSLILTTLVNFAKLTICNVPSENLLRSQ